MNRLNEILHELGISKVKLAKFLGVSRQMIYNYLELDDLNKWPKDKKVLLLNLLSIKSPEEIDTIKVDTDYILSVETKMSNLFEATAKIEENNSALALYNGLGKKQKQLMKDIINIVRENLEDENDDETYTCYKYLYNYMQTMSSAKELKYILAYNAKSTGFIKPLEFAFDENEQFLFESIMFSAMRLYAGGGVSKSKIAEFHRRFVAQIEIKMEEKLGRTLALNKIRIQALKELGYTEINSENASIVFAKFAEIESRSVLT
ncbi:MAG: hypothetical protein ACK5HP_02915 [Bacilli bacterium]